MTWRLHEADAPLQAVVYVEGWTTMHPPFPSGDAIAIAVAQARRAAISRGVPLHRIEWLAPSEVWNCSLAVIFFYETAAQVEQYVQDGTSDWLRQELTRQLETIQKTLPFARMPAEIFVEFDWRENVLKNYRGDYFLRLR